MGPVFPLFFSLSTVQYPLLHSLLYFFKRNRAGGHVHGAGFYVVPAFGALFRGNARDGWMDGNMDVGSHVQYESKKATSKKACISFSKLQ